MPSLADLTDRPRVYINTNEIPSQDDGIATASAPVPKEADDSTVKLIFDRLLGLNGQERYQLWPEKIVREGLSAAHDAMTEGMLPAGLRREDFTDIPAPDKPTEDSTALGKFLNIAPVAATPADKSIEQAQAISALAGTGGLGGVGSEAGAALGSSPFLRPALKYGEKLYKGKPGQQHLDLIPPELYPEFQKQALNGDDISHWNFGFMNDKGHFLDREKALQYGVDNGILDPQDAKFGALTSTLMSDSSKPGSALEAVVQANKPFYSAVENAVANAKQPTADAAQWLGFLKNQPGVKQEELQHLGLDKLQGPISKDDLLKAVQEGQPQISTVVKNETHNNISQDEVERVARAIAEDENLEINTDTELQALNTRAMNELKEHYAVKNPTKYHSYQLPGGPLSRDTEILTNRGWKRIDAVKIGDVVMTRKDKGGVLEWQPVLDTPSVYAENLYHFFSQSINMRVTENHQMIAKKRRRNQDGLIRLTAKELWNKSEMLVPLTGTWKAKGDDNIFGFNPNDLAELFGWYVAEGSCKLNNKGGKNTIQIAQSKEYNPEKCERIEALLDRMNLPWRYYGNAYGIGIKTINKDLVELFHEQPTSEFKFIPYFFFEQSKSVIQSLLDGLILGDGCTSVQEGRLDKTTFFTKSQQLADDVQILALLVGKCANVRQRPSGLYVVGVKSKEWSSVDEAKFEISSYNDFAFCVTVENHAIYVRRNGVAAFTGNSNYQEHLLTLPEVGKSESPVGNGLNYRSSHWDEPNVLAHIRMNDRDIDGKKTLHVEEVQSDWHQAGRKKGYGPPKIIKEGDRWKAVSPNGEELAKGRLEDFKNDQEILDTIRGRDGVPDAPFKKTWDELALKHIIDHAVRNGYDQISWTPGEAQAARYDLSKHLTDLKATRSVDGRGYTIDATKKGNSDRTRIADNVAEKDLPNIVGKEMADKIKTAIDNYQYNVWGVKNKKSGNWSPRFSSKEEALKYQNDLPDNVRGSTEVLEMTPKYAADFSGLDLKVGGEGMKAFYDKMLVDKMNALGKKFGGGKVSQVKIATEPHVKSIEEYAKRLGLPVESKTVQEEYPKSLARASKQPVHTFPITPELREQVLKKGLPLFSMGLPIYTSVSHNPFKTEKQK